MKTQIAYKLLRTRKNGTLGSLFINRKAIIPIGVWIKSGDFKTSGYAHRPGWHCTIKPYAPHLSLKGRTWYKVEIKDFVEHRRPEHQGGLWFLAKRMRLIEQL